ncbi:universal stress protein [Epibacterium ulvae]|uniref:Nucleotide-binding universal stress protein, UspA family n=1 Tax=Epibacterium ulvae TaxID=1156985 RepID=A0A1G5PJI8_9RHOB|nr:universal stress protein [Epibacterium ulvae]SCZ49675.1 Nucleotide-binding universal stress protein, UspA family [Epibacterium ulvae]
MNAKLIIGLDGEASGSRALSYGKKLSNLIGDCAIVVVYVIEWSPFTFQTAEENAQRHKRREEELKIAQERIIDPAIKQLAADGITATGIVRHGDVADTLNAIALEEGAEQIVVARSSEGGISRRLFGSATSNLVMHASVPVTVVG